MLKWLLAVFLALILLTGLQPWLARIGIGRLPGDLRFQIFGRRIFLPFASTILLCLMVGLLTRVL